MVALCTCARLARVSIPNVRATRPAIGALDSSGLLSRGAYRTFASGSILREKKYTEAHEWIELSPDKKTGTIGISTYAAAALGDVVFVELPKTESEVKSGDALAAVESVKSASDIYAPCAGTVREINSALEATPGNLGKRPEQSEGDDGGWLARLELPAGDAGKKEVERVEALMSTEDYKKFTE